MACLEIDVLIQQINNMKRLLVIGAAMLLAGAVVRACDMCGGGGGDQYIGLLPAFNRNIAGLQYLSASYSGTFPALLVDMNGDDHTKDHYHTMQAWARHRLGKHYQVFVFVPYQYNRRVLNGAGSVNSGIGDLTVMVNRVFVATETGLWKHTLFGGAGIKLPTGKSAGTNSSVMPATNPGTGTYDFIFNGNYTLQLGKVGLNADVSGVMTNPTREHYKYGNRFSTSVTGFYAIQPGNFRLTPQLGLRQEYANQDYYNYERGWLNTGTGGNILSATVGVLAGYRNYGVRLNYLLPVSQYYADGQVVCNGKAEAGFFILF
jgi:hypothetical protein